MANAFDTYLYTTDGAQTHPIRVNVNTAAAQKTAAVKASATAPAQSSSVRVSGSANKFGIRARYLNLYRSVTAGTGAGAVTRKYTTRFPVLLLADYSTYAKGATVTINTVAWTVSSGNGEDVK